MKTDKFKRRKVGAPRLNDNVKRVDLVTTVSPVTLDWLDRQHGSRGRAIDELVKEIDDLPSILRPNVSYDGRRK